LYFSSLAKKQEKLKNDYQELLLERRALNIPIKKKEKEVMEQKSGGFSIYLILGAILISAILGALLK